MQLQRMGNNLDAEQVAFTCLGALLPVLLGFPVHLRYVKTRLVFSRLMYTTCLVPKCHNIKEVKCRINSSKTAAWQPQTKMLPTART
jgi:hypothetical protein